MDRAPGHVHFRLRPNSDKRRLVSPQNKALIEHCRLASSVEPAPSDPFNPRFTLTMLHAGTPDTPAIALDMLGFLPALGNVAVWRDGVRLWDIEPITEAVLQHALRHSRQTRLAPGDIRSFTFDACDRFSCHGFRDKELEANSPIEGLVLARLESADIRMYNPFQEPGQYRVSYELLLYPAARIRGKVARLTSNTVEHVVPSKSESAEAAMKHARIEKLDKHMKPVKPVKTAEYRWVPATDRRLTVRGLAWFNENNGSFCRLPLRAKDKVRDAVWQLAQCPAGAHIAFRTDATEMAVRITNSDASFMTHMAMTGSAGVELFCGSGAEWRQWAVTHPDPQKPAFERELFKAVPKRMREFKLYLPLYKGMIKLEIGLSKGARILPPAALRVLKPVVFYGTSITQGGCASTAGGDYASILGRMLDLEPINLGFSGNGKGEPEIARLISEIDASLYVLDYAANAGPDGLKATLPGFVNILRKARPKAPILLLTGVCYAQADFSGETRARLEKARDITMEFYVARRGKGDSNIHLADSFNMIPFAAPSAFVDGVHPTSHGFQLFAEQLVPLVRQILLRDN